MPRCAHCGGLIAGQPESCPECEAPVQARSDEWPAQADRNEANFGDAVSDEGLATIARFHNIAEAGFFAHELMHRESLPVQLSVDESFDAISGLWNTRFLLCVPESQSKSAAAMLQRMIEQTDTDGWDADEAIYGFNDPTVDSFRRTHVVVADEGSIHWLPIMLTLAAGSFVLWGVRKFQEQPVRRGMPPVGREHTDFWDDLSANSKPWVQLLDDGRGVREFWIDAERDEAVLREDADGNGHFEKQLRFRRSMLAK